MSFFRSKAAGFLIGLLLLAFSIAGNLGYITYGRGFSISNSIYTLFGKIAAARYMLMVGGLSLTGLVILLAMIILYATGSKERAERERVMSAFRFTAPQPAGRMKSVLFRIVMIALWGLGIWFMIPRFPETYLSVRSYFFVALMLTFIVLQVRKLRQPSVETLGALGRTVVRRDQQPADEQERTEEVPPQTSPARLPRPSLFGRLGIVAQRIRRFFSRDPESIRAGAEAELSTSDSRRDEINARAEAEVLKIRARTLGRIARTQARQNFFTSLFTAWTNHLKLRRQMKVANIEAKAAAKIRKSQAKVRAYERKLQAKSDYRLVKAEIRSEETAEAREQEGYIASKLSYKMLGAMILSLLLVIVGVAMHNVWILTIALWAAVLSARAYYFALLGKLIRENFYKMLLPRLTTAVVGSWLISLIANLAQR